MTRPESADTGWPPPPSLRRLRVVAEEARHAPAASPAERLRMGCELIAFALNRLEIFECLGTLIEPDKVRAEPAELAAS
ncbi:MAG: hypothetical protein HY217_08495 [Candidatus Rokubacteria bacterium]|nr:hypothetical protein [Candidatus Rokubacteria bacterium]